MGERDVELITRLRAGGCTLLLRHGASDSLQIDREPIDFADCTTQRNLSAKGREEATAIGRAIAKLSIPIGRVLSSPYCRAAETARLAFGRVALLDDLSLRAPKEHQRDDAMRRLLAEPPNNGANTVLVTHQPNIAHATGVHAKPGEAAIFASEREQDVELVARVEPSRWLELVHLHAD